MWRQRGRGTIIIWPAFVEAQNDAPPPHRARPGLRLRRRSTAEVLALLHKLAPAATCEKASIDEVYLVSG